MMAQNQRLEQHRFIPSGKQGGLLARYEEIIGKKAVDELREYREGFSGRRIIHVNSTFVGGGVAEILRREVPLANELGITTEWYRIKGNEEFFETTKGFHNALQGRMLDDPASLIARYHDFYQNGGGTLNRPLIDFLGNLSREDVVIIHDPQPLYLIHHMKQSEALKLWRIHIDTTTPDPHTMSFVVDQATHYDGIISTMHEYVKPHLNGYRNIYMLAPSIDPFSDKNRTMLTGEVRGRITRFGIQTDRPLLVQVSRLDPWKDPCGVIDVFETIRGYGRDCHLALVYNSADDDPEGAAMEQMVKKYRDRSPYREDIHLVIGDDPQDVNAFQRHAAVVIQKSIREGFGLTVTEALFKEAPTVVNEVGGITLQVLDGSTGFSVKPYRVDRKARAICAEEYGRHVDEFARTCIRAMDSREDSAKIGKRGREAVVEKFLATSKLKNLLDIILDCGADGAH
jgi:trehalose synthase